MVNYKPDEERNIDALLSAMQAGMDPTMALGIAQGVEQGALARMAQNRAMRQEAFGTAASQLREAAASGLRQGGAQDLVQSYMAETPGLARGPLGGRLEDLAGDLYQGPGATSSLYAPEPGGAGGPLDPQFVGESMAEATTLAAEAAQRQIQGRQALGGEAGLAGMSEITPGPSTLHDLRMTLMTQARAAGFNEQQLAQLYSTIGTAFTGAGGDAGTASIGGYGMEPPGGAAPHRSPYSIDTGDQFSGLENVNKPITSTLQSLAGSTLEDYARRFTPDILEGFIFR